MAQIKAEAGPINDENDPLKENFGDSQKLAEKRAKARAAIRAEESADNAESEARLAKAS